MRTLLFQLGQQHVNYQTVRFFTSSFSRNYLQEVDKLRLIPKTVHLKTCKGRSYKKPSGLDFDASYLDVLPRGTPSNSPNSQPTILYLTGYIASHKPIRHFLLKLADRTRCRVVAPLWPVVSNQTKGQTEEDNQLFGHTIEEHTEFALDFVQAANLTPQKQPLESIIAHSGGAHAALALASANQSKNGLKTKSLALLCPNAPRPISKFGYEWMHRLVAKYWEFEAIRPLLRPLIKAGISLTPLKGFLSSDEAVALLLATMRINSGEVLKAADDVVKHNLPTLLVYSDQDEWIPVDDSLKLAERLKFDQNTTEEYQVSRESTPQRVGSGSAGFHFPRHAVRLVTGGTHWPQRTCPDLMLDKIANLIECS